ncbi:hypothetical protein TNCV_2484131 [Trichonephila clavipes]|uniref:Uncharacterized protein n=1 Tax=Trichonephila clavipes TaxID=2585209 RepID=A0A8X7BB17_TRICX|nr:hypothetical protein TNCV_2484131 [Trichonephila clavipes]
MPLRKAFTFKNAFKYFRRVMPELSREYKKFDLSYLDNVAVFSEGWDFPIDHMDGILELNTHLAVVVGQWNLNSLRMALNIVVKLWGWESSLQLN